MKKCKWYAAELHALHITDNVAVVSFRVHHCIRYTVPLYIVALDKGGFRVASIPNGSVKEKLEEKTDIVRVGASRTGWELLSYLL